MQSPSAIPLARSFPLSTKSTPALGRLLIDDKAVSSSIVSTATTWKVQELMALPPMHLLERCNVYVSNTEPAIVAQRIAECLRTQSIAATFFDDEAKVQAETREHVQFTIRLWSDKDQVVVEVQRGAGCCFLFCQASKAILRAAKGSSAPKAMRRFTIPGCVPQESVEERKQLIEDDLEIASSLLKKDRLDAHMLGMESLCYLSNATKCCSFAAKSILGGECFSTLLCLVQSFRMHEASRDETLSDMEEKHFAMMHRHALTVLANCLVALEESGELEQVLSLQKELLSESLLQCLVEEVAQATTRPHDACQAVRCLQSLVRASSELKTLACHLGASKALDSAHREGVCRHATLEQESGKLQLDIGNH